MVCVAGPSAFLEMAVCPMQLRVSWKRLPPPDPSHVKSPHGVLARRSYDSLCLAAKSD